MKMTYTRGIPFLNSTVNERSFTEKIGKGTTHPDANPERPSGMKCIANLERPSGMKCIGNPERPSGTKRLRDPEERGGAKHRMIRILLYGAALALFSCHSAPQETRPAKADTAGAETGAAKPKADEVEVTPTIENIVAEFRDSTQQEKVLDTTRYVGADTLRLVIRMARIPADSFLLPTAYLEDVDLTSFQAWNMSSSVRFFVNGQLKSERNITKKDFAGCTTDKNIRRYGVLMYPEVDSLDSHGFQINYSLTIPLTDVGTSVTIRDHEDAVALICDKEAN
jgi:hypothetical protein